MTSPALTLVSPPTEDPATVLWVASAGLCVVAALAFYGAFRALKRARLLEDVPTSRIRSAAQGYTELAGWAELLPGEPIVAPLSARPCVWYRYRVDERTRDRAAGRREWRALEQGVSDGLFRLADESGGCVVDPEAAEVTPATGDLWYGDTRRPGGSPPKRQPFWLRNGRYRYREELIRPGDPLHAVGMVRTVGGPADQVPPAEDLRTLLAAWKRDPSRMRAFDANSDGRVDVAEWETARRAAETEVQRDRGRRAAQPGTLVLGPPSQPDRPYLLSALRQHDLARRYRWTAVTRLGLFALAGAGAVLLARLGLAG